ncbi:MAG: hypothetical protein LPJ94_02845 [Thauera sp.]|nr:hypothetical protein [Thauera sp.]
MSLRRAALHALVAIGLLNLLLSFGNAWPTLWPRPEARLSLELAIVIAALALGGRRGPLRSGVLSLAAGLIAASILLHYTNVTVPAVFGRRLDLYWDGQHAWEVLKMGAGSPSASKLVGVGVVLALAIAALYGLVRRCLAVLAGSLQHPRVRSSVLAAALVVSGVGLLAGQLGPAAQRAYAPTVAGLLAEQAGLLHRALIAADDERLLGASPAFDADLDTLEGADVIIVFAEAYGAITLDHPAFAAALVEPRRTLREAIEGSGRQVVSARLVSPTFGGGSWLAHAELLSGLDMRNQSDYRLLLTTRRPTLASHFAAHGYRTVGWMPGIQRPWPEGRFYGFDRIGTADTVGYGGPMFGYWRIPDQAAMALLQDQELGQKREDPHRPRLVVFPTISTHAPFRPLAPYVEDWGELHAGQPYAGAEAVAARAAPVSWEQPIPAYLAAMRYQFDWLAGWLKGHAPPDAVLIVIGDHQPIGTVTGPGADWDVPVHVITRNETLLARLVARGFVHGLVPQRPALGPMRAMTPLLIEAFGRD